MTSAVPTAQCQCIYKAKGSGYHQADLSGLELQRKGADAPVDGMQNDTFRNGMSIDKKVMQTYFNGSTKKILLR